MTDISIDDIIRINIIACNYFHLNLSKNKVRLQYVLNRISKKTIKKFKIGYADGIEILPYLDGHGISKEQAILAGLVFRSKEGNLLPVFKDRIVIPIVHAGIVVGFGGRSASGFHKSKYINTKKNELFNKSEVLYGLWHSRKSVMNKGYLILLEGYFDYLSLVDNGILNCSATCGTSLTEQHAIMIKRYTNNLCVAYDGDEAGLRAYNRVEKVANLNGLECYQAVMPKNLDPDEVVKKFGKTRFLKIVGRAI